MKCSGWLQFLLATLLIPAATFPGLALPLLGEQGMLISQARQNNPGAPRTPGGGGTYNKPAPRTPGGGGTYFAPPGPLTGNSLEGVQRGRLTQRGTCPTVSPLMTALVPAGKAASQADNPRQVWGYTTQAQPSFWFYLPYTANPQTIARLRLLDDRGIIHEETISLPAQAQLVEMRLPKTITLEPDRRYRWSVSVFCNDPKAESPPLRIQAGVVRLAPTPALTRDLARAATPRDRARIYAQNGVWYDALATLATLRRQNPQDPTLLADWNTLLESVGLQDVADKPIASK